MFEITVSREFEDWYQALDAAAAESVAADLNLLERLGPELDETRAGRLLLWFDGMAGQPPLELGEKLEQLGQLMRRRDEALRCLEHPDFQARFLQLEPHRAQHCHELIDRLRASVRAAALQLMLQQGGCPVREPERIWLSSTVRKALDDVLSFVGLKASDVADTSSGLRELKLGLTPAHRLLYAIDVPRRRILAFLAEPLTRAYYGDSVRRAERRWREYCRGLPVSHAG